MTALQEWNIGCFLIQWKGLVPCSCIVESSSCKTIQNDNKLNLQSAYDLFRRCVEFVSKIETMYQDSDIIVVSHDDVLSVLQTALLEGPASLQKHRQYAMKPAEIRLIDLT